MSATTLSNLRVFLPVSSKKLTDPNKHPSFVTFLTPIGRNGIKAIVGAEGRDNVDQLQRSNKPLQKKRPPGPELPPIGLWDRFPAARRVQDMMETMDALMEDQLAYNNGWSSGVPREDGGGYRRRGRTPWEIKEGEKEYKMRFDMPGMTKNDVKVYVEEKMLVVKAEKVAQSKEEEEVEEWTPKSYGRYSSRIELPENVLFDKIKAEVKDGVLYMTIPKASATSKMVEIDVQ